MEVASERTHAMVTSEIITGNLFSKTDSRELIAKTWSPLEEELLDGGYYLDDPYWKIVSSQNNSLEVRPFYTSAPNFSYR